MNFYFTSGKFKNTYKKSEDEEDTRQYYQLMMYFGHGFYTFQVWTMMQNDS